jgi:hypothetical protein
VLQARECILIPSPFVIFTFGLAIESIKEFGGVSGWDVVFSDYPTFLMFLVTMQSSIDSNVVRELCFFCVVGPNAAYLESHIVFFWAFQFLLLIIHIG